MSAAIIVPWRDVRCPHRTRALEYVTARLAQEYPQWPVVIGEHSDGAWCKAAAVDAALAQTDAATLILHDADVWTDGLAEAVQQTREGAAWAIPHRGVHRLTEASTALYAADAPLAGLALAERAYLGVEGGGVVVIGRDEYEAAPFDRRFVSWGSEDESAGFAWRCLYGPPWRGKSALIHFHHPPQARARRNYGSIASLELRKRYARARRDPAAMRNLIEEAKTPCH